MIYSSLNISIVDLNFYVVSGFYLILLTTVLFNLMTYPVLRKTKFSRKESISVLIPVRNEEHNIGKLLESLLAQTSPIIEIIILDDDSTDETPQILKNYAERFNIIKTFKGNPLEKGWLGKNYACHQLGQKAVGEFFLFLDADITLEPNAISGLIQEMKRANHDLLSVFPQQVMETKAEKSMIPMMHFLLLTILPLKLVRWLKFPIFAAANGGVMLFKANVYKQVQPHQQLKIEVLEDIQTVFLLKKLKFKCSTLLSNGSIKCRMYQNKEEVIKGFSKNFFAGFHSNLPLMITYFYLMFVGPIIAFFSFNLRFQPYSTLFLILIFFMMDKLINILAKHKNGIVRFYTLNMVYGMFEIAFLSVIQHYKKTSQWKGRKI